MMDSKIIRYEFDMNLGTNQDKITDIQLRSYTLNDVRMIYNWRNHPNIRRYSFDKNVISFETHYKWSLNKLHDEHTIFLIAQTDEQVPVGAIRYDLQQKFAIVSIYVAPELLGKGFGRKILIKSIEYMKYLAIVDKIIALVKTSNIASVKLFERCGFVRVSM